MADLRGAAFLTDFFASFATAPLRAVAFLLEVFVTFLETLFFLLAVFFATPHLLKLRRGGYGDHATVYRRVSAWRVVATLCHGPGARDAHEPLRPLS
ncbi:hypothetical protein NK6_4288 [Bradyrhizobium diazoefficiens]|uniref:Uncharacterized protein n=1 Tax=Bradyrhizobium diazoefficiens TaxID=1355477 RepID=A0A0E4FU57_9BRAD|nr:hypothetical protein NK6_4288 [Bradyrhizobium diazoefficiens]